ncbi:hypothetical protein RhiirA1_425350 [Rhizophagus irregularis]|uniref:Uncharacterized protein n=1 Tax=Rhizophagus irregularis TaxID=588596 RepID=A0A2N0RCD1_9GLOM|nr:hypothetical protein RhiirA1_425350 [Rhizophagus irregularis]
MRRNENKRVRNFVILCKTTDGKKQMGIGLKFFLDTIVSGNITLNILVFDSI